MKKFLSVLATLYVFALFPIQSAAITLSLDPSVQNVEQGNTASVDLNISGLGDFAPDSLGAFLVEVTFDDSVLSFNSAEYGTLLGDPLDLFETDIVTTPGVGSVSLDEFSFLFDFELDALQPDSFTLATLTFTGSGSGSTVLGFGTIDLSNAIDTSILDFTLETASITVESLQPSIPEPATSLLVISGLLGLVGYRYRQRSG